MIAKKSLLAITLLISSIPFAQTITPESTNVTTPPNLCGLTIKYYSGKLKLLSSEQEISSNTAITINPITKTINVTGESPTQDKVNLNIAIESAECNLNENCTAGQAIYHGYINSKKGAPTKLILKVEARSGSLVISNSLPGSNNEYLAFVSKWEIIKD